MKKFFILIFALAALASCETNYDMIDTGLAKTRFNGNMYEYLKSNSYDWDSVRVMIEHAGMKEIFEGKTAGYENFTFLGPTNHSIRRWLIEEYARKNGITPNGHKHYNISDLSVDNCRNFINMHIIKDKKIMRDDVPRGTELANNVSGGMAVTSVYGNQYWLYTMQGAYNNVANTGAVTIYQRPYNPATGSTAGTKIEIQSSDIQCNTGVVQALSYNYNPQITAVPR